MISSDAPVMLAKASELFIRELSLRASTYTEEVTSNIASSSIHFLRMLLVRSDSSMYMLTLLALPVHIWSTESNRTSAERCRGRTSQAL
jgi:hypothetical protein